MAFCKMCGNEVTGKGYFCPKCGQTVEGTPYQQQANHTQHSQQSLLQPNSNMGFAIFTTIFCCLPTGIYAIIQSALVEISFLEGNYNGAVKAAEESKKWSVIGVIINMIAWIICAIVKAVIDTVIE